MDLLPDISHFHSSEGSEGTETQSTFGALTRKELLLIAQKRCQRGHPGAWESRFLGAGSWPWIRSGHDVSESTARNNAARVLAKANIKALVRQHLDDQAAVANLTVDLILREYMRLGFSDNTNVVEWSSGELTIKDLEDLTPDVTAAISEISQVTTHRGGNMVSTVLKVKMHSKTQALDSLAKHLNLFRDTVVNNNLQLNVSISDLAKLVHPNDETQLASGEMIDG